MLVIFLIIFLIIFLFVWFVIRQPDPPPKYVTIKLPDGRIVIVRDNRLDCYTGFGDSGGRDNYHNGFGV